MAGGKSAAHATTYGGLTNHDQAVRISVTVRDQVAAALEAQPEMVDILGVALRMMQEKGHGEISILVRDGTIQHWEETRKHRPQKK